jgi:hypothetical protein
MHIKLIHDDYDSRGNNRNREFLNILKLQEFKHNILLYTRGYETKQSYDGYFTLNKKESKDIEVVRLFNKANCLLDPQRCLSINSNERMTDYKKNKFLIIIPHRFKRQVPQTSNNDQSTNKKFYKVKIASIILFTDDTSGNSSKPVAEVRQEKPAKSKGNKKQKKEKRSS